MSSALPPSAVTTHNQTPSRRSQTYMALTEKPHRPHSIVTPREATAQSTPQRTQSRYQAQPKTPSIQQDTLAHVARRDYEQSNLVQAVGSRRSTSRDEEHHARTPSRPDSGRTSNRNSTRASSNRYGDAAATVDPKNQQPTESGAKASGSSGVATRRRTTIGASTGQWALGKTIGAGSMGKVKLAKNMETGEQVAVKIVPRTSTDEYRSVAEKERVETSKEIRTAREAAIVALVDHPYICSMKDVVKTNYHWYMLFEYVNGGQMLDYIISHGKLKEKQARRFGRQIASALYYCHQNSIVHRDLKIENILISKTGDIKIIDFGLSNLFSPRHHLRTFCGSLYFAAPELLQAKQYIGPEVDIWSFGIVLYVLVCGKVPFDDQSMPQLHAKIKKGVVEYPPWLSSECKNLISRMLMTDPKQRASLSEIMNHAWMIKGFNGPPESHLPHREPLQLPLDQQIVEKMTGFDFGSAETINAHLTKLIESEDYQQAVRLAFRRQQSQLPDFDRKRGVFEFYKRRNSIASREALSNTSSEAIQVGVDSLNAFSPLLSVYNLVREKQARDELSTKRNQSNGLSPMNDKRITSQDISTPQAAVTNSGSHEMKGEPATGGRSRPRSRTQGEDSITEAMQRVTLVGPGKAVGQSDVVPTPDQSSLKKEHTATGILRRFSTRKHRDADRDRTKDNESLAVGKVAADVTSPLRKSFSVRRTRDRDLTVPLSAPAQAKVYDPGMLAPPTPRELPSAKSKGLSRSTSVNSADMRRRLSRRLAAEESGGERSQPRTETVRNGKEAAKPKAEGTKLAEAQSSSRNRTSGARAQSLGHGQQGSTQNRQPRQRIESDTDRNEAASYDTAPHGGAKGSYPQGAENIKPVYLKGLFSVSTTSSKPLYVIRADIIRVLNELGVEYREIKGGFTCRHAPSIDLNKVVDKSPASPSTAAHKRRISIVGLMGAGSERDEIREQAGNALPRTRHRQDRSNTTSDESDDSIGKPDRRPRPAGETSTQVQSDLGQGMVLRFEILVVKVPILSLHGIQFKKVDGGTWQYKNMAQKILTELRL